MRTRLPNMVLLAAIAVATSGCSIRFKGVESFNGATTPVKYSSQLPEGTPGKWNGDPGSFGGTASASGGTHPQTNYGAGSNANSPEPVGVLDQPAKGTGQLGGEFHAENGTGHGQSNAPAAQPSPSQVDSLAARSGH